MPLNPYFKDWKRAIEIIGGRPVVFTNGCFDVFHAGHVHLLYECKRMTGLTGSVVVGLNSDRSVRRLKGASRPLNDFFTRRMVLRACKWVDIVIPFDEDTPEELIRLIQPDILVKDAGYANKKIAGSDFVKKKGGKVVLVDTLVGVSTTEIVKRVKSRQGVKLERSKKAYHKSGSTVFKSLVRAKNCKRADLGIKQRSTHVKKRVESRAKTMADRKRSGKCQNSKKTHPAKGSKTSPKTRSRKSEVPSR